jgi:hypothetical protein
LFQALNNLFPIKDSGDYDEILLSVLRKRSMQPQSDLRNFGNDVYSTDEENNEMLDLPITTKATIHRSVGNGNKMLR